MNTTNQLLDEAKEKNKISSDNQLAIALGITRSAVSEYRRNHRKPDSFTMARLAEFTGRPIAEVLAMIEAEREQNAEKREYWKDFLTRIGDKAAALFFFAIVAANELESLHCILCQIAFKKNYRHFKGFFAPRRYLGA